MSDADRRVLILGAGGHARVIAGLLAQASWQVAGVLDDAAPREGERVLGHAIVGTYSDLTRWRAQGVGHVALALGDNRVRWEMAARVRDLGFTVIGLRHPSVVIEPGARVAENAILCAKAVVGADARIGEHVLLNTGASVDHECVVEDAAHIAPGAVLAGRVRVGRGAFVGAGAVVRERIRIGDWATVAAGAVVVADVPDGVVVMGVPARIRQTEMPGRVSVDRAP